MSAIHEQPVTQADPVFERILCATELSPSGVEAVRQAAMLAGPGGTLEIVSVAPDRPPGAPRPQARQIEALVDASMLAGELGVQAATHIIEASDEAAGLLTRCAGHDLLVAPAGEPAFGAMMHSPIPVLVARPAPAGSAFPESVLVAVDGTPAARDAARLGARLAARHGALVALVATPQHDAEHQHALEEDIATVSATTGVRPVVLDEQRPPAPAILGAAALMDSTLIVLGSRPGTPVPSVSTDVARGASCSVLVLRPGLSLS